MDDFLQDRPHASNRFRTDLAFRRTLERLLGPETFEEVTPELDAMGALAVGDLARLAEQAEAHPPQHVPFDAWGRRVDRLVVDPAWLRLVDIGMEAGLVAIAYEGRFGDRDRILQFGLQHLFMPASATADCPMAMTDAAARVLLNEAPELSKRYVPLLTRRQDAFTSGQWMTEKEGGSDVGRTSTIARPLGDGTFTLHGTKWFTSATTADIALALARPQGAEEGSRGLSLFLLELRNHDGSWNGISVRRLKDKLGTRALPTAELDLDGCIAVPVGELGRGVAKIAPMLNITRVHAAFGSSAGVGAVLSLARDYASRREAFGRMLRDLPAHRTWMATIAATYEAGLALSFRAAELLGASEHGSGDLIARTVIPLTKMALARQGVWACSELLESFGGAGYLEDTGLPRALRDLHVQCIWEGTTSVMALDVLRALSREGAAVAFLDEVRDKVRTFEHPLLSDVAAKVLAATDQLASLMTSADESSARRLAWGMARTYQAALLHHAAGWELDKHGDATASAAARTFASQALIDEGSDLSMDETAELAFGRGLGEIDA
ncbi:MAG TPA: acyl-CoA dehydrogenase family protein [Actinomycetota bacterium]|nr:acyl-CoA dehydrogenase family protein [Actinomycetota bacterium]